MIGELVILVRGGGGQMIGELTAATKLIRGGGGGRMGELATDPRTTGNALEFAGFAIAIALESTKAVLKATPQAFNVVETIFGTPLGWTDVCTRKTNAKGAILYNKSTEKTQIIYEITFSRFQSGRW
jgi:hypothetical protein